MTSSIQLTGKYARIAQNMLADVCSILRAEQIDCWLDSGTLLGIVRENRLLPWDNDVDISVRAEQIPLLLQKLPKLEQAGYFVEVKCCKDSPAPLVNDLPRIIKVYNRKWWFFRGPVLLDIFVQTKHENRYYWSCRPNRQTIVYSAPAPFFDELKEIEFAGHRFLAPADTDGYLTYRYGDWRTPKKDWDITKDDNALS